MELGKHQTPTQHEGRVCYIGDMKAGPFPTSQSCTPSLLLASRWAFRACFSSSFRSFLAPIFPDKWVSTGFSMSSSSWAEYGQRKTRQVLATEDGWYSPYLLLLSLRGISFHSLANTTSPALLLKPLPCRNLSGMCVLGLGERWGNHGARK